MTEYVLRDYQELARDFLRSRGRAALMLDMGLGKTASCLAALEPRHLPAIVFAPKRVAENVWDVEVAKFRPDLSVVVAKGEPEERYAALRSGADIVCISRDFAKDIAKVWKGGVRDPIPFQTVIVDELSAYKTRASVRWKTMRKIVSQPGVHSVWGLTGTPAPNGLLDLWAQIFLLDGGQRLGRGIGTYRQRFFTPASTSPDEHIVYEWALTEGSDAKIFSLIDDIAIAMETDGRIELPPISYNDVEIDLPPGAMAAYNTIKKDLVVDLEDLFGGEIHSADTGAILSSKLRQLATGFIFQDARWEEDPDDPGEFIQVNQGDYTWVHDETVKTAVDLVDEIGAPVLMAYQFQPEKERLLAALGDRCHTIDEPDVIKAWNRGEIPVLLVHPASAAHGLNLQDGGHHIVWASPTWELEHWEQFNKRLWRSGQKHAVVVHSIIRRKTIDDKMRKRLDKKELLQNSLKSHLESPI